MSNHDQRLDSDTSLAELHRKLTPGGVSVALQASNTYGEEGVRVRGETLESHTGYRGRPINLNSGLDYWTEEHGIDRVGDEEPQDYQNAGGSSASDGFIQRVVEEVQATEEEIERQRMRRT
jgi:hypothetical protein